MSARTMVAGTSTTNRTGASGGELLLEPVPGGDEPPSLRPGESPPSKPQWMRWRTFERKYAIWRRVVDSANGEFTICANADLAQAPRCRSRSAGHDGRSRVQ